MKKAITILGALLMLAATFAVAPNDADAQSAPGITVCDQYYTPYGWAYLCETYNSYSGDNGNTWQLERDMWWAAGGQATSAYDPSVTWDPYYSIATASIPTSSPAVSLNTYGYTYFQSGFVDTSSYTYATTGITSTPNSASDGGFADYWYDWGY